MNELKLIIVAGMSGVGKSTTAQNVSFLYSKNGINHEWYHEEMKDHPIRWINGGEFTVGDINTYEGMELNIADTYSRWEHLINDMRTKGGVYVMEGCLYQNIIRYFLPGNYPKESIIKYYGKLMKILEPANPHIIHLYRPNVAASFKKAFRVRGEKWERIITEGKVDFDFADESVYQTLVREIFAMYKGKKLAIDTSQDDWITYYKDICAFLDINYYDRQYLAVSEPEIYVGDFMCGEHNITIICENKILYCSPPWFKHIKMNAISENVFELSAFPLIFNYSFTDDGTYIKVDGNYDWGIEGKTLVRRN